MSNDLNLLLKTRVVKLRAELDTSRDAIAHMKTQVKTISGKLEETPVKLRVELQATLTELKNQLKSLHTKLVTSKSYEPIKIGVQIDVNGSVINIKRQLQQVQSTVEDFNKKYGKQLDQMQKLQIKAQEVAKKAEQASTKNISTKAGAQNFNNIKEYTQALADAEKHLKSTLPQGKQGFFSSKELKDAKGNLHGFVASLEKMNGVVESVSYQFDDAKQRFQIVDRKTLTATEKNLYSNMKALSKLGGELDKTGKKADVLFEAYEKLAVAGDEGKLDSQMIANFKSRVEMAKKETLEAEKKKKVRQEELLLLKKIMDASKGSDMRFNERTGSLVTKLSNSSGDAKLLQDATFEYKNLKKEIDDSKRALSEYEKVQRRASILERELNKLLREEADSSELLTTQNLKLALSRAKNAKTMDDLNRLEKKTAEFRANLDTTKDIRAREEAFLKLRKVMLANADLEGRESKQTERILQNIKENENTSLASLNSRIKTYERLNMKKRESLEIDRLNMKARSYVPEENGFSNKQLNSLISKGDFNEIREYIAQTQKLDLALAKVAENKKGITTITGTLNSTGKTTKQVTYEVDELTKKLRFMGSQEVFNRNANLGIFEQLKIAMARVPVWMASMTAFYGTIRGVQAMTNEILQLDKAMTELRRVASSNINMDIMFEGAVKMSGSLGANMHEVLNTMGEMARTFGDFNERQLLAITNTATLMANVSDLSVEEAGNNLVGTMNAFNLEAEDSIHIADALNEVDNNYAISTKQLSEALSKSASTSRTFGVTLEENIGHITAIGAVTMESGAIIGNSLKTIYSRITTIPKAAEAIMDVGVAMETTSGDARRAQDIMADLAERWDGLSASQQQNIAVQTAGRYQLSRFLALMNNWDMATEATNTAITSQGSAMRENAQYLKSFEARLNILKNTFTELSSAMGDAVLSGGMLAVIEGLGALAKGAIFLVDKFGALPAVFLAVFAVMNKMDMFDKLKSRLMEVGEKAVDSIPVDEMKKRTNQVDDIVANSVNTQTQGNERISKSNEKVGESAKKAGRDTKIGMTEATVATRGFGIALKSALISTGIGVAFVGIGILIEQLIGKYQEQKTIMEEAEKLQKKQIDGYRTYDDGMKGVVGRFEELRNKTNRSNKEQQEYLKLQKEIATNIPTTVAYVDANGEAHMKSTEQIKKEIEAVKELSKEQAKASVAKFESDIGKKGEQYDDLLDKISEVTKKTKELNKTNGKDELVNITGIGDKAQYVPVTRDNTKELKKSQVELMMLEAEKTKLFQKSAKLIQEQSFSYIEANGNMSKLGEQQKKVVENFVSQNEVMLRKSDGKKQFEANMEKLSELSKTVADTFIDSYDRMDESLDKNDESRARKLEDYKGQMEAMAKALPDSFYKVADASTGKVVKSNEQIRASIEGIVDVNKRVAGGETNIKKLQSALENQGLSAKQSKDFLHKFALENDNVKLKTALAKEGINAQTTEIESLADASLEAVDAMQELFGYGSTEVTAIKSNIQNMQTLVAMYGEGAKETDSYKNSQQGLGDLLGLTASEVEKQGEKIYLYADAMEKANLGAFSGQTRADLEKYINGNKELTKAQKDIILHANLEKDAITGQTTVLGYKEEEKRKQLEKTKQKHKEVRDEVEKKPAKNGIKESIDETDKRMDDFKSKQQQALDSLNLPDMNVNVGVGYNTDDNSYSTVVGKNKQVADSYKEVENNKNAVNSKPSFNSEDISADIMAGKVGMVADESNKAKSQIDNLKQGNTFNMNDTSPDVIIGKVKAVGDSFDKTKQKKNEANQSIMFNTQDTSSEVVKGQVDGVTKSMQKAKDKINEFKQSQIFPEASAGTDPTQARVDELVKAIEKAKDSMGILGTMQGEIDNTQNKLAKLLEQARNTASGVDSVSNKSKSIDHLKHSIERIVAVLSGSQEKIGGLFNGLEASASRVTEPVSSISSKIESIGRKASTARERTEKLVSTISKIGAGGVGNVKDYTQALGLMSGNLNLVASYGRTAVRQQTKIVDSFNQVISKAKAYNSAMSSLSKNNGEAYARMDAKVRSATNSMKSSYEANKRALSSMSSFTQKNLSSVKNDFDKMSDDVTAKMTHMTTSMHLKFKSGIKGIVSTAGTIPAQIGKAIKDNMSDASTELDALAKDMVKRFKSELGIHSPSRVFTKLGGHVIEGLVNGLSGGDLKSLGGEVFDDFGGGVFDSWDMIKAYVSGDFSNIIPSGGVGGGGVQQWAGMATKALMMTGQYSESNLQKMLYQMQTESGGNAMAINDWDINAINGTPSKGLMQVIDPTFRAYAMPGFNKNVYDPLSNMLASIRYAVSRYGNLSSAYRGVGYAKGGLITEQHMAMVGEENKKEMVIPLERYRSRAIGLWEDAGDYLGIDPELLALIREQTSRGGGGMAYGGGGSFGASEGASGATGGGDSGTSGTIINATPTITPQILGGYNMDGEYAFSASATKKKTYSKSSSKSSSKKKTTPKKKVNPREGIAEAFDYDAYDRMAKAQEAYLSLVQARSDALNKTTVSYRDSLKKIIGLQTTILASQKKELANTEREQKSIKKKLKDLPSLKKQTTKQREVYNKLMQDYDTNITKIQGLRSSIEENMRSVKNRSLDIFNDFIDSIVSKFDKSIESIKRKIDDTDFKIEVISLIKPDDKTASMNALVDKAKQQQELQATEQNKVNKLQDKYEDVRDKKGKESKSAKSAKKKLDKAKAVVQKKTATTKDKKAYASSQKRYEAIVDKEGKKSKKAKLAKAKLDSAKRLAKKSPTKVNKLKVARYEKEYDKVVDVEGAKSKSARKEKVKMDALRKKATIKPSKKELDTYNKAKKTYNETVEREGNKSPEAKKAVEELRKAKEDLEDAQLATLQAEKAIKDARLEVANNGIDALKNYYGQMSEMAGKAYDLEIEKQTKAHQTKMENYDKEIQKVGDYYNELFAKMDEEKAKSNYEEELKSKTDKKAELVNKIAVLSRDTSLEGRSKVKKLQEELATVNKDLSDFQSQKAEDDARKALEAQRDKKISDLEATKTKEDEAFNGEGGTLEKLQKEKEAIQKKYDDIIKNEEHWAKIRELAQSGHFGTLTKELEKMDANIKNMQKGQFDGLSAGYKNLSADIKKQMQEILELDVDNLGLANKGVTGDVKETDKAKDYKVTNGKVSNSKGTKVDTPDYVTPTKKKASPKKTTSKKKTPSKKKPAPKKKSSKKKPAPKKKASESKADRKITTAVSFRSKPDYGNNIIKTLAKDTKVDYLGMEKGWAKIKYGGKVGYVGSSFLKKFDTGGYTGNSLPKGGGLAVLHNKEIVLNKQDTKNILDVTKLVRGMVNVIPKLKRNALSSLTGGNNVNTTISYGDINVTVENGDKKKSKEIASEIISGLKKRGKK